MNRSIAAMALGFSLLLVPLCVFHPSQSGAAPPESEAAQRRYVELFPSAAKPVTELTDEELAWHFALRWFESRNYFRENRWLDGYTDDGNFAKRVGGVARRVGVRLPQDLAGVLPDARALIRTRRDDLLAAP